MVGYLTPELVELSPSEVKLCEAHADALERAGIRLSVFGATTVAINGLPARLKNPDASGLVRDVVAILERKGRSPEVADVLEAARCREHRLVARDGIPDGEFRIEDAVFAEKSES